MMRHAARAAGQHSSAFSFSRGGSKKRIKVFASVCTGSCRPPVWPADMIRNRLADARRFRTATAHSACALYVVMPIPRAALAQKVGSSNTDNTRKTPQALRACGAFLELLGRFELPQRISLTRCAL